MACPVRWKGELTHTQTYTYYTHTTNQEVTLNNRDHPPTQASAYGAFFQHTLDGNTCATQQENKNIGDSSIYLTSTNTYTNTQMNGESSGVVSL